MKISIIIPAYNVEEYIEACIQSVFAEKYSEKEVIVVNDGSTDRTAEKLALLETKFPFQLITQENAGLSAARNRGVAASTGDYIGFLDSDDVVLDSMYQHMMASLENGPADVITIGVDRLNTKGRYPSVLHQRYMKQEKRGTTLEETPELLYDTTVWNKLFKRTFWEANDLHFEIGRTYEDIPVALTALIKAEQIHVLPEVGYLWRARSSGKSITQQRNRPKLAIDRLHALRLVDQVFQEVPASRSLQEHKQVKFLEIDLFSLIEWLFSAKEPDRSEIQQEVIRYMEAAMDADEIHALSKRKQAMYQSLLQRNELAFKWHSYCYFIGKAIKKLH
ncbi:glycosyltransferase family 2 protein [Listeria costaricensis]|uniref:glycosyltransferase family 2 protein n=1 Tax=Listeria costaricensis TaxID=2026604 RepID=UPI000C06E922|nr:glycosyltransferase [Listeria costaricensis]